MKKITTSDGDVIAVELKKMLSNTIRMGDLENALIIKLGKDVFLVVGGSLTLTKYAFKLNSAAAEKLVLAAHQGLIEVNSEKGGHEKSTRIKLKEILSKKALSL